MITTINLATTSIPTHSSYFFFVVRAFKIYFVSHSQVYDTILLAIITIICIRSPNLLILELKVHALC